MAIFQNNILKQEETLGGFEPNLEGDETFALNNLDVYPADLPDFAEFESFQIPEQNIDTEVLATTVDNSTEGLADSEESANIWEQMFTGELSQEQNVTQSASDSIDLDDLFAAGEDKPTTSETFIDESSAEEIEADFAFADEAAMESEDTLRAEMLKDVAEVEAMNKTEVVDAPVVETKTSAPEQTVATPVENKGTATKNDPFLDVEALKEAVEIDLSVLPEHPTTAHVKSSDVPKEEAKSEEPEIKKVKKPMNKKLLRRIATYSSIVLILIGGGSSLYYFGAVDAVKRMISGSHVEADSNSTHANGAAVKHEEHKTDNNKHDDSHSNAQTHDTTKKAVEHSDEAHTASKVDEHSAHSEVAPKQEHSAEHSKPAETKHEVAKHEEAKKEPKHDDKKHHEKKIAEKKDSRIDKSHKEPKHETKKITEKHADAKKINKKEKSITPVKIKENKKSIEKKPDLGELYSIQIYASPSKEDAQDWVKKVKRKNSDVYISTQVIRDKVWYRVRCGHFSNKEEAKNAAEKLGFSQSWVDRIR